MANRFASLLARAAKKVAIRSRSDRVRAFYWNARANEIDDLWGRGSADYPTIRRVLDEVKPRRLLDIGCGSGRLFPLYFGIETVCAQDVSRAAIELCKKRHRDTPISYIRCELDRLAFAENYFDLVISNRVLSAILPDRLGLKLAQVARITSHIYINELSDSDDGGVASHYWFKHDYSSLLARLGFRVVGSGKIEKETWHLYKKTSR